ncbi:outer membrane protein transport protein [Desulfoluna sp.]|uniref:OmpP1/FadL family transporter n=1 Tax=Desulfoluna sp. TaxID=2045199 RepID=UPI0026372E29|nr:outer membrane protein transport protein [Desulfoluna sp.]
MVKRFACAVVCVLAATSMCYAGSVDTYGIGARATALGGAYAATADDPFAAYYNPAGLSQIEGKVFAVGAHGVDPTINMSEFTVTNRSNMSQLPLEGPANFSDDSDFLIAPHMGYAQKLNDSFALGVAAYAPWGMELDWEKDPTKNPGSYSAYHSYYRRFGVTPTLSYKVNDKLAFGVGVTIGKSEAGADTTKYMMMSGVVDDTIAKSNDLQLPKDIPGVPNEATNTGEAALRYSKALEYATDPQDIAELTYAAGTMAVLSGKGIETGANVEGVPTSLHGTTVGMEMEDDLNYSYNFGVMYRPIETITMGLAYRSECDADFEGDVLVNGVKVRTATMDYNHPQQVQAGVRYQPHSKFSIECDVVWTDWSVNQEQVSVLNEPLYLTEAPVAVTEEKFHREWEDTKQLRFGMEYILNDMVTLRGGYFYDPTPIPDTTLDMQWPDADKKTYSLGAGFNFGRYSIDTVLQYIDIEQARHVGGESANLNESFQGNVVSASADGYILGAGVTLTARF